jgi:hypothetical protein
MYENVVGYNFQAMKELNNQFLTDFTEIMHNELKVSVVFDSYS